MWAISCPECIISWIKSRSKYVLYFITKIILIISNNLSSFLNKIAHSSKLSEVQFGKLILKKKKNNYGAFY